MAEAPQSYAHHTRWDPIFHFFLIPVFVVGVIMSLIHFFAHLKESDLRDDIHSFLIILFFVALLLLVFKVRLYSLKVQDRVIRLEERLRLTQLCPERLRSRIPEITENQLCGLRFASDAELPQLAERALNEKLTRKQIKQAIQSWRADNFRV